MKPCSNNDIIQLLAKLGVISWRLTYQRFYGSFGRRYGHCFKNQEEGEERNKEHVKLTVTSWARSRNEFWGYSPNDFILKWRENVRVYHQGSFKVDNLSWECNEAET
ncbi:hypothetical protein AMTR_s00004p00192240 [Amborella trichopoda]|uniref:Uncharacterized protein n=1 Tax=Amborella trichopoda TaxID=13333 RepID=W1NEA5_AMBTC|nr:hypothetical protein AMTR_s00004p00192240 [Amborella trichopoda]